MNECVDTRPLTDTNAIPQSYQGIDIENAKILAEKYMALMVKHEESTNYRVLCECGRQVSKLYYDAKGNRSDLAKHFYLTGYPQYAVKILKKLNNLGVFKNDDIWFSSYYLYTSCMNYSDYSGEFSNALVLCGISNLLIANIGHKPYLENLTSKNVIYLIKTSLYIMFKVIAHNQNNLVYFNEEKVKRSLVELFELPQCNDILKCLCLLVLCHILQETDIGLFNENKDATSKLKTFVSYMEKAVKSPEHRFHSFAINDFVYALSHLSILDSMKKHVCESGVTFLIVDMFKDTSLGDAERQSALLVLWSLGMAVESRSHLVQGCGAVGVLLKFQRSNTAAHLSPFISGVLRSLQEDSFDSFAAKVPRSTKPRYAYLSFHSFNRDTVMKVKSCLDSNGVPVYVDTSSNESLNGNAELLAEPKDNAKAIAMSSVVLLCISESYKYSPVCRTDAEFAGYLNKPIIPISVVKRCRSDGWVAKILGNITSYDVVGCQDFNTTCTGLSQHIRETFLLLDDATPPVNGTEPTPTTNHVQESREPTTPVKEFFNLKLDSSRGAQSTAVNGGMDYSGKVISAEVQSWSSQDVAKWLEDNQMKSLTGVFRAVNGRLLYQLSKIRTEAPDYFYKSLEQKWGIDFLDILKLTDALDQL